MITKIKPVFTEKSMKLAKSGFYTFAVSPKMTKFKIKNMIEKMFSVKISGIRTINYKKNVQKTLRGKNKIENALKKVLVALKSGKIDLFEEMK